MNVLQVDDYKWNTIQTSLVSLVQNCIKVCKKLLRNFCKTREKQVFCVGSIEIGMLMLVYLPFFFAGGICVQ